MPFQNIDKHDANVLLISSTVLTVLTQITVTENMHLIPDTCYVILYMLSEEKQLSVFSKNFYLLNILLECFIPA